MNLIVTFMAMGLVGLLASACSSNAADPPGDPDGGSREASACMTTELATSNGSACASCVASRCAAALDGFQSSCGTYLACVCSGGSYADGRSSGCQSSITADCANAGASVTDCETSVCSSSCVANTNPFGSVDGGADSGPSTVAFTCTMGSGSLTMCALTQVASSSLPMLQQTCVDNVGQPGSTCTTAGLAGCCTYSDGSEQCYYDPSQLSSDQASCAAGSGKWSSTSSS